MQIGERRVHPRDGVIRIIDGAHQIDGRVSNHWTWVVEATGQKNSGYGGHWPLAPRKTLEELAAEIAEAYRKYACSKVQHVKTGGIYMIVGAHFREHDMALCLEYSPDANPKVFFSRSIEEMDFGTRFVFIGGPVKTKGSALGGPANHFDHTRRGFEPK